MDKKIVYFPDTVRKYGPDVWIQKQATRLPKLATMGFKTPKIINVTETYATHQRIPEPSLHQCYDLDVDQVLGLWRLQELQRKNHIYIGDLNSKNLHWYNNYWYIIDCGSIREDRSCHYINSKLEKQLEKWGVVLDG